MPFVEITKSHQEERFNFFCDCGTRYVIPFSKIIGVFQYKCPICGLPIKITEEQIENFPCPIKRVRIEKLDYDGE